MKPMNVSLSNTPVYPKAMVVVSLMTNSTNLAMESIEWFSTHAGITYFLRICL